MTRRLPSLNQLRAFEAAARHESIKKGAEELCVTPAAVGHHIKGLELELNTDLFLRKTRKIELTEEGRALFAPLEKALNAIEQAVAQARRSKQAGSLKITIAPFFGNRWLLPRLPDFHERYPGIEIKPSLSFDNIDLGKSNFNAALRYGEGDWEGMICEQICNDVVGPVCAPQLINGRELPMLPQEILDLPLACGGKWRKDWQAWAAASDAKFTDSESVIAYESRAFMFDAALSGQAVILADARMTAADEAAGSLVRLSPVSIDLPQGIYIVSEATPNPDPRLQVFADWLKQQACA